MARASGGPGSRRYMGHSIEFYHSMPSTMPAARRIFEARGDDAAGAVVIADHQTAGRGRLARGWEDAAGRGLLGSYILCGEMLPGHPTLAVMAGGLALMRAIGGCCPRLADRLRLKWPNDVISLEADGPVKLAGILVESIFDQAELRGVILGIGVNVNQHPEELPSVRAGGLPPSSLKMLADGGRRSPGDFSPIGREHLLAALCRALDDLCAPGTRPAAEVLHVQWEAALHGLDAVVAAHTANGIVHGRAVGTSPQGALLVRAAEGGMVTVHAGDVDFDWASIRGDS